MLVLVLVLVLVLSERSERCSCSSQKMSLTFPCDEYEYEHEHERERGPGERVTQPESGMNRAAIQPVAARARLRYKGDTEARVKFPAQSPVTAQKLDDLRARIARLGIDLGAVEETFVRAGGPGGQKVNKTSSGVALRYAPLDLAVKWTRERSQALNRFLALRELVDEAEAVLSPATSERVRERERARKQKDRRRRRTSSGE